MKTPNRIFCSGCNGTCTVPPKLFTQSWILNLRNGGTPCCTKGFAFSVCKALCAIVLSGTCPLRYKSIRLLYHFRRDLSREKMNFVWFFGRQFIYFLFFSYILLISQFRENVDFRFKKHMFGRFCKFFFEQKILMAIRLTTESVDAIIYLRQHRTMHS